MNKMVSRPLTTPPTPCSNLHISLANDRLQNFLCWEYFIRCRYSISDPVSGSMMALSNFCSWPGKALPSNLYWTSVNPRQENRCVSYFCVKVYRMFISSCGIILVLFSWYLYQVMWADGMVDAGVFLNTSLEMVQWFYIPPLFVLPTLQFFLLRLYHPWSCTMFVQAGLKQSCKLY